MDSSMANVCYDRNSINAFQSICSSRFDRYEMSRMEYIGSKWETMKIDNDNDGDDEPNDA